MKPHNLLIKIIKFGLVLGHFSIGSQLFAENITTCPKDFPKGGVKFVLLDKNKYKVTVTETKALPNLLSNESLEENLEILKLEAVERIARFMRTKIKSKNNDYSLDLDNYKPGDYFIFNWNKMKRILASMEEVKICIQENRILFVGELLSESYFKADEILNLQELYDELLLLEYDDPKFDIDKFVKKYPKLFDIDDPKLLRKIINDWKKNRTY